MSMDALPRRGFPWKVVALLAFGLLAAAGAVVVGVRSAANRQWARLEQRTEDLLGQWYSRPGLRPPLYGTPIPGNAWDDYIEAAKVFRANRQGDDSALGARSFCERHSEVLALLTRGAHRTDARYANPVNHRDPFSPMQRQLPEIKNLPRLIESKAWLLGEEGRHAQAAELLLDLVMFGRDLACRSLEVDEEQGSETMNTAFQDLRAMVLAGQLGMQELRDLDDRLAQFEGLWPSYAWSRDAALLHLGDLFRQEDREGRTLVIYIDESRSRRQWRFLWSSRLQAAKSFFDGEEWIRRISATDALPWPQAWPLIDGLSQEKERHPDQVLRDQFDPAGGILIRESQAEARLLRIACRYRLTGEVLTLADPFGDTLRTELKGGRLRAWSRGPFPTSPTSPEPTGSHRKDLQIEVDR